MGGVVAVNVDRPVRIGVQLAPQHLSYELIRSLVSEIEVSGADVLFTWDHFFPLSGDRNGSHFEAWSMLSAWAESTSNIEIGTLVSCATYRNPDLLADMAKTIDHISVKKGCGRFILGLGSGWFERDFDEYGYRFGTTGDRIEILSEAISRIKTRWPQLNPQPTKAIPLLIGGDGELKTLRIVAAEANIWHSFADPQAFARKIKILESYCADLGRDPSEIEISTNARIRIRSGITDFTTVDEQYSLGARLLTMSLLGPQINLDLLQELIAWRDSKNTYLQRGNLERRVI